MIDDQYIIDSLRLLGGDRLVSYYPHCPTIETPTVNAFDLNLVRLGRDGAIKWRVSVANPSQNDSYFAAINRAWFFIRLVDLNGYSYKLNARSGTTSLLKEIYR